MVTVNKKEKGNKMDKFKNLEDLINLSKEEIEGNNENITATLDLTDLRELKNLLDAYKKEKDKIRERLEKVQDKIQELSDEQGYWGDTKLLNEEEFLLELLED